MTLLLWIILIALAVGAVPCCRRVAYWSRKLDQLGAPATEEEECAYEKVETRKLLWVAGAGGCVILALSVIGLLMRTSGAP